MKGQIINDNVCILYDATDKDLADIQRANRDAFARRFEAIYGIEFPAEWSRKWWPKA